MEARPTFAVGIAILLSSGAYGIAISQPQTYNFSLTPKGLSMYPPV